MIFLYAKSKISEEKEIDNFIFVELPDKDVEPELFGVVTSCMIHRPCGPRYPMVTSTINNQRTKHFPKKFVDSTSID